VDPELRRIIARKSWHYSKGLENEATLPASIIPPTSTWFSLLPAIIIIIIIIIIIVVVVVVVVVYKMWICLQSFYDKK